MATLQIFSQALINLLNPSILLLMVLGVGVGIVFGSIPGLSAAMAVALFLPITFSMDPVTGMALLVSLYIGGISGGLISAILLNIPGTPSSIATCFDGSPMAAKGDAGKALGLGVVFSFLGGLVSFIILIFISPPLAKVALKFSAIEYFAIAVFALTMIAALSSGSLLKGLLSGMLGITLGTVGLAPIDGTRRFTLGISNLSSGFDLLPVLIGLFAVTEVLILAEKIRNAEKEERVEFKKIKGFGFSMKEFASQKINMIRSAIIGIGIGILPGIGGSTSGLLAYIAAKKQSKEPEKFGTGCIDGIVASETANNATIGGALIPLLALGIPGDGVTAMLLGAFMIHGLTPGPLLFKTNADLVYGIFAACFIANFIMLGLEFYGMRIYVQLLKIPKHILMPIILVLSTVGAFAVNNRVFDAQVILLFGLIGYLMHKFNISMAPIILSFILGELVETNLRRGLMLSDGSFMAFFTKPIAAIFLIIAILSIVLSFRSEIKKKEKIVVEI